MSQPSAWEASFSAQYQSPADNLYGIAFTPRSGSTWLGDVLAQSGRLGEPREYFNLDAAQETIRRSACYNLPDYYRYLKTVLQTNGTFGFEATLRNLNEAVNASTEALFEDVKVWFLLRRKDYVAQAVSLYRADLTGVFHATTAATRSPEVPYDGDRVASTALNILASEFGLNRWMSQRGVAPLVLWYEDLVAQDPADIHRLFYRHMGMPMHVAEGGVPKRVTPAFRKLADAHSASMAARFRDENPVFVAHWDEMRGRESVMGFLANHPQYSANPG